MSFLCTVFIYNEESSWRDAHFGVRRLQGD